MNSLAFWENVWNPPVIDFSSRCQLKVKYLVDNHWEKANRFQKFKKLVLNRDGALHIRRIQTNSVVQENSWKIFLADSYRNYISKMTTISVF